MHFLASVRLRRLLRFGVISQDVTFAHFCFFIWISNLQMAVTEIWYITERYSRNVFDFNDQSNLVNSKDLKRKIYNFFYADKAKNNLLGTCAIFWKLTIKKFHISDLFHNKYKQTKHITKYDYSKDRADWKIKIKLNNNSLIRSWC